MSAIYNMSCHKKESITSFDALIFMDKHKSNYIAYRISKRKCLCANDNIHKNTYSNITIKIEVSILNKLLISQIVKRIYKVPCIEVVFEVRIFFVSIHPNWVFMDSEYGFWTQTLGFVSNQDVSVDNNVTELWAKCMSSTELPNNDFLCIKF